MSRAELDLTAKVAADGTAEIQVRSYSRRTWIISQVSIYAPTIGPAARGQMFKGSFPVSPFIASSTTIGGEPPVDLRPGEVIRLVWTGATPNADIKVKVMYDDGQ